MISCTEFIPLYSEFFKYLEAKGGADAVMKYWHHISDYSIGDLTNPNSLAYKCEKLGGFLGAKAYWGHTLTEEACDMLEICDNEKKFKYSHIRRCPSRGMLNSLEHIEPYHNYCEHCNVIYQRVLDKYGIIYERDHSKIDNAECASIFYEVGNKPDFDFKNLTEEDIEAFRSNEKIEFVDLKSEDNKYLHRDFHLLGDLALKYCGEKLGEECVIEFLTAYTKNYYSPVIKRVKENGLSELAAWLEKLYEKEEASELLHTDLTDTDLTVTVDKSPVIEYMRSLGQQPSKYYIEETRTLYKVIAEECGLGFELEYYNEEGGTKFKFFKI